MGWHGMAWDRMGWDERKCDIEAQEEVGRGGMGWGRREWDVMEFYPNLSCFPVLSCLIPMCVPLCSVSCPSLFRPLSASPAFLSRHVPRYTPKLCPVLSRSIPFCLALSRFVCSALCPAFVPVSVPSPLPSDRVLLRIYSVLRVYLGMVLHANKRYLDALDMLELASKLQPSNPQVGCGRKRPSESFFFFLSGYIYIYIICLVCMFFC